MTSENVHDGSNVFLFELDEDLGSGSEDVREEIGTLEDVISGTIKYGSSRGHHV